MGRPYFKFCSADSTAKILKNNCIYVTSPVDLNDPFEMRSAWTMEHEIKRYEDDLYKHNLTGGIGPEPTPPMDPDSQYGISDIFNERVMTALHHNFRVLSLVHSRFEGDGDSKSLTDTLLWSHYGDSFQGASLMIDPTKFNNGIKPNGVEVEYDYKRKPIPPSFYPWVKDQIGQIHGQPFTQIDYTNDFIELLSRKSPVWEYEDEVRMIYDITKLKESGDHVSIPNGDQTGEIKLFRDGVKLPPESIVGIVLGADCSNFHGNDILNELKDPRYSHVKLYLSYIASEDYKVKYLPTDITSAAISLRSFTEQISRLKGHTFYRQGGLYHPKTAVKGTNYIPPRNTDT